MSQKGAAFTMAVGDLGSTAKGSGARANGGKPDYSLLNLQALADSLRTETNEEARVYETLLRLGMFQAEHDVAHLNVAFGRLQDHFDACARVFAYGKQKYAAWNWAKGMAWSIPLACAVRHLMAIHRGEGQDPESGESHWGHVLCNIQMLQTFVETYPEGNDLPPKGMLD